MFISKTARKIDKQITKGDAYKETKSGDAIISLKACKREEIFSSYNYNSDDVINKDLTDYVWHKSKLVPLGQNIKLQMFCNEDISKEEVSSALKNYYRAEYLDAKSELKNKTRFSLVCLFLGVITLLVLSLFNTILNNFYLTTVIDILAWVFVWEAFDVFFFQRSITIRKLKQIQRLYTAKIEIKK